MALRLLKLLRFTLFILGAAMQATTLRSRSAKDQAQWLRRKCVDALRVLNVRVHISGSLPNKGLIVANHLGYIDVIALASATDCAFVCKREIQSWPIIGSLVTFCGTIFVNRQSRTDTRAVNREINERLAKGIPVVVFPEGTSSDGGSVLFFHTSLIQPAVEADEAITPLHLRYESQQGDVAQDVCYWGTMSFLPHLWRFMGVGATDAYLSFGEGRKFVDRRTAATESRQQILAMSAK